MNKSSVLVRSLAFLLVGGCTANFGRIDSFPTTNAIDAVDNGSSCLHTHQVSRPVATPETDVTTFQDGTTSTNTVLRTTNQESAVCDEWSPGAGPSSMVPPSTDVGVAVGIMGGYTSFDAKPKATGSSQIHKNGLADSIYGDIGVSRSQLGAIAIEAGFLGYDLGADNNLTGLFAGLRVSAYTPMVEPYIGFDYAWTGISKSDAPTYVFAGGLLRHIVLGDHDLLARLEVQWLDGVSGSDYRVSGFALLGTLGWYFVD